LATVHRLFGTDGVRGVAGVDLTAELARELGAAAARHAGPGASVLIGRDTRESGVWLEQALVEGIVAGGGTAVAAGVLPTPGVAVLTRLTGAALGCVISASHNPYPDNGIKFLGGDGRKLTDPEEAAIERRVGGDAPVRRGVARTIDGGAERYASWLEETYGAQVPDGLRLALDCANGAAWEVAPALFRRLGVDVLPLGVEPDGRNINAGVGSTHLDTLAGVVRAHHLITGIAFDGDSDRCLAVDDRGRTLSGDVILAVLAIDRHRRGALDRDRVVVTSMTNLGFHRLMRDHGIRVEVTDVGDRHVLERMLNTGATLGGEQSGHVVELTHHTTGDGLATALLLLGALHRLGLTPASAIDLIVPFPQKLVAVPADRAALARSVRIREETAAEAAKLRGNGRIVVRASGTEAVVRVMVEAADEERCAAVCDRLAAIVRDEIGL
jgi:phosphoglucosamine mutase